MKWSEPMKRIVFGTVIAVTLAGISPPVIAAGDVGAGEEGERRVRLFPEGRIFEPYLADPHRPGFGILVVGVPDPEIRDSGSYRFGLKLGGRFGVVEIRPQESGGPRWYVAIEAGFYGQFDMENSLDNIGWDGIYGLIASTELTEVVDLKAGIMHVSSHVGDEYAERTGRTRIDYTREEAVVGISWELGPGWRAYGEGAWAYVTRNDRIQDPGRLQLGAEYEDPDGLRGGRWGWYLAANLNMMEEEGWSPDTSIQGGVIVPSGDRRWRIGLSYYDGRVPIGEFVQDEERFLALGLWLDV